MYFWPAGSDAGAATIVVYSIAPASSSAWFTWAIVVAFWPMATYTHRTWRAGSPESQLSFWLMIVSIATAVLPVCRSPMISSRWPRPMAVIASMALIPVCSGSLTGCRLITDGAWTSSGRNSVPSISPLPSIGLPSGPTTRPRNPSPTGTERISPVRRTRWPCSIWSYSPRMTTPISRTSRFRARPRVPSSNSSSSLAMVEGRPSTRAMPSPHSMTVPTSSLEAASGSYASTKRASASRISSGRIVSSAIFLVSLSSGSGESGFGSSGTGPGRYRSGCQPAAQLGQAARHASVDELAADTDGHSAYDLRVEHHVEVDSMTVGGGQRRCQPVALVRAELGRHVHLGHQPLAPLGGQARVVRQARLQATSPGMKCHLGDQPQRRLRDLAREQRVQQLLFVVGRDERIRQRGPQVRLGVDHPAEPEQLILELVQLGCVLCLGGDGDDGEFLGGVGQLSRGRPVPADQARHLRKRGGGDLLAQQRLDQPGFGPGVP